MAGFRSSALVTIAALVASASAADAARFKANNLEVNDVIGDIRIVTNSGDQIDVRIDQGKVFRTVQVLYDAETGTVTLQGEGDPNADNGCCEGRISRSFDARADRRLKSGPPEGAFDDYPVIEIAMPRASNVSFEDVQMKLSLDPIEGALHMDACYVYGEASAVGEARIGLVSGSRMVLGEVEAGLEVDLSGAADLAAASASVVDIDISGSGQLSLGRIDGILDASIAGSGLVRAARIDGPVTARIAGSGAVIGQSGRADPLKAIIEGSGGVYLEGSAASTDLRLSRSAEVRLGAVEGRINRSGLGEVYVKGERVARK